MENIRRTLKYKMKNNGEGLYKQLQEDQPKILKPFTDEEFMSWIQEQFDKQLKSWKSKPIHYWVDNLLSQMGSETRILFNQMMKEEVNKLNTKSYQVKKVKITNKKEDNER